MVTLHRRIGTDMIATETFTHHLVASEPSLEVGAILGR